MGEFVDSAIWGTGFLVWLALTGLFLWLAITLVCEAFDATWFLARVVLEGGTKNLSARNLWLIWWASFARRLHSARAADGYRIVYPGYGKNVSDDE